MPTKFKGNRQQELALDSYIKLTRATESVLAQVYPGGKFEGLTISQFGTLEVLYHLGPMCQGEIGGKLLKSSGNMTLVIDNLEKLGLVARERDPEDRRQVIVKLTVEGRNMIKDIFPRHVDEICAQFAVLDENEQKQLSGLLKKLGTQ